MWLVSAERVAEDPADGGGYGWTDAVVTPPPVLRVVDQAERACLVVRVARISAGAAVTLLGIALLVLPGPGLAVIAGGLSILSIDVPSAQRLLQQVKERLPQDADGGTPGWLVIAMGAGLAVSVAFSVALTVT